MATRFWRRTALYVGLTFGLLFSPVVNCSSVTHAQTAVSVEFRTALEPHGQWTTHERWGEVWIPANVDRDWEPYKIGHWVYTEEWGWYWVSDETFGVVVYHYGRWIRDRERWVWIPGREWGPGWVNWRRGGSSGATAADRPGRPATSRPSAALYVGWSPLPPDDVVVEYWERPEVWIFVRAKDFTAPNIARVILPPRERVVVIKETVVENRTVVIRERGIAVNPGIPPTFVAAAVGRPIRAVEVRPAVLAGTVQIQGAREIRPDELRRTDIRENRLVTVRETQTVIRPTDRIPPPQALSPGEQGRLGDNPPRAARAAPGQPAGAPGTPTTTQDQRQQPGTPTTTQDQRPQPGAPATTQDQRPQPGAPATTQDQRQPPGAPTTTQDQRPQPGAPATTQDQRQRRGAPTTTQDQRQRPDRPDAAQGRRPETPATAQEPRQQRDRPDAAQDQRQQPPAGAAQERRQQPPASAQEQRPQRDRPEAAQDQRQQRGRDAARERQQPQGGTEGRAPPANQRPDAQPAARPDRPEGQRSEQRGEQRGQQAPGQQQKPAGQRPGRAPDQGEKKDEKKDER